MRNHQIEIAQLETLDVNALSSVVGGADDGGVDPRVNMYSDEIARIQRDRNLLNCIQNGTSLDGIDACVANGENGSNAARTRTFNRLSKLPAHSNPKRAR
jgi:hypothetical protein